MGLFCPVFWEKYSTYHPCVIIIKYNLRNGCWQFKGWITNEIIDLMFTKRNWFISLFRPPIIQKRSNFIILPLFNGVVIYISPLYQFLTRKGTFPSLGRFSNVQKYFLSLSFQDVKYSSTQYIVPESKLWRIPALCYDLNLGMIFYFQLPHTHTHTTTPLPEKSWFQ